MINHKLKVIERMSAGEGLSLNFEELIIHDRIQTRVTNQSYWCYGKQR